jgi:hypothetical protein
MQIKRLTLSDDDDLVIGAVVERQSGVGGVLGVEDAGDGDSEGRRLSLCRVLFMRPLAEVVRVVVRGCVKPHLSDVSQLAPTHCTHHITTSTHQPSTPLKVQCLGFLEFPLRKFNLGTR